MIQPHVKAIAMDNARRLQDVIFLRTLTPEDYVEELQRRDRARRMIEERLESFVQWWRA